MNVWLTRQTFDIVNVVIKIQRTNTPFFDSYLGRERRVYPTPSLGFIHGNGRLMFMQMKSFAFRPLDDARLAM